MMNIRYSVSDNHADDPADMRIPYCDTLMQIASEDPNLIILDADLMVAAGLSAFREKYPERAIDCGIQEANMIGVAAGLSLVGKIPFAHSFAAFASRRCFDQAFISGGFARANVKIVGSDPGIGAATNGGTHQGMEDMGIMCSMPSNTVIEPSDNAMCRSLVRQIASQYGMCYMRLYRKPMAKIYEVGSEFEIGKAVTVRHGTDVTIVTSGICVGEAIKAAEALQTLGISAAILDCFTWKPLDEESIIKAAASTRAIVTVENHNVMTGLGAIVSRVVARNIPVPMETLGIPDSFGEVGPMDYLMSHFGISCDEIVSACRTAILRKAGRV